MFYINILATETSRIQDTCLKKKLILFNCISIGCTWDTSLPREIYHVTFSYFEVLIRAGVCFVRITSFFFNALNCYALLKILFLVSPALCALGRETVGSKFVSCVFSPHEFGEKAAVLCCPSLPLFSLHS